MTTTKTAFKQDPPSYQELVRTFLPVADMVAENAPADERVSASKAADGMRQNFPDLDDLHLAVFAYYIVTVVAAFAREPGVTRDQEEVLAGTGLAFTMVFRELAALERL